VKQNADVNTLRMQTACIYWAILPTGSFEIDLLAYIATRSDLLCHLLNKAKNWETCPANLAEWVSGWCL